MLGTSKELNELYDRIELQETRFLERPDQTGVLTTERGVANFLNNQCISAASDAYEKTSNLLSATGSLFDDYDQAEPNDQPQVRYQIEAKMDELAVMMINFEGKVKELEEIKK